MASYLTLQTNSNHFQCPGIKINQIGGAYAEPRPRQRGQVENCIQLKKFMELGGETVGKLLSQRGVGFFDKRPAGYGVGSFPLPVVDSINKFAEASRFFLK